MLNHVNGADARMTFRRRGVHGNDLSVGHVGIHKFCEEHSRQLHVGCVACSAHGFGKTVPPLGRFSDILQILVDRPDRRLCDRNLARFIAQRVIGHADRHIHGLLVGLSTRCSLGLLEHRFFIPMSRHDLLP